MHADIISIGYTTNERIKRAERNVSMPRKKKESSMHYSLSVRIIELLDFIRFIRTSRFYSCETDLYAKMSDDRITVGIIVV